MNLKVFIHSLLGAIFGGAIGAIASTLTPTFTWDAAGLHTLMGAAITGAVIAVAALLKRSPLEADTGVENPPNKPCSTSVVGLLAIFFLSAICAQAQTAFTAPSTTTNATSCTSPTISVTTTANAIGYYAQKTQSWYTGTHTIVSIPTVEWGAGCTNQIAVEAHTLNITNGTNHYLGGLSWTPDISKLIAHTVWPPNTVGLKLYAAFGDGIPAAGTPHTSWVAGTILSYRISQSIAWNIVDAGYNRFGSTNNGYVSSGLKAYF